MQLALHRSVPARLAGTCRSACQRHRLSLGSNLLAHLQPSRQMSASSERPSGTAQAASNGASTAPRRATDEDKQKLVNDHDCFIFDCDGVIWRGDSLIEGVPETLDMLRDAGKRLIFVTNNATKSRQGYTKKFSSLGLNVTKEEIFSSSYAAAAYLQSHRFDKKKKVYVIGDVGILEELDLHGFQYFGGPEDGSKKVELSAGYAMPHDENVGAVIVGFDKLINYYKIQYATLCITENPGCLFIATNLDARTHLTDAQEWAGNGSMVYAGLTNWSACAQCDEVDPMELPNLMLPELDIPVQADMYKYMVQADGNCAALRLRNILASDNAVFVISSNQQEWYHPLLQPFRHFIPVATNISPDPAVDRLNLVEMVHWAEEHPDDVSQIVDAARKFSDLHLTLRGQTCYMARLLLAYSALLSLDAPQPANMTVLPGTPPAAEAFMPRSPRRRQLQQPSGSRLITS